MSSENQRPRRTPLHPLPVLRRVAIRERVVGGARERVTDLAGDLLLEPGGLLPQRLHARGGRARTTRRRTGPAEATRGPGPGGLQPPLWFSPRFARLAWIASSVRLSGAFAVVGFPHGPFSSEASRAAAAEPRACAWF